MDDIRDAYNKIQNLLNKRNESNSITSEDISSLIKFNLSSPSIIKEEENFQQIFDPYINEYNKEEEKEIHNLYENNLKHSLLAEKFSLLIQKKLKILIDNEGINSNELKKLLSTKDYKVLKYERDLWNLLYYLSTGNLLGKIIPKNNDEILSTLSLDCDFHDFINKSLEDNDEFKKCFFIKKWIESTIDENLIEIPPIELNPWSENMKSILNSSNPSTKLIQSLHPDVQYTSNGELISTSSEVDEADLELIYSSIYYSIRNGNFAAAQSVATNNRLYWLASAINGIEFHFYTEKDDKNYLSGNLNHPIWMNTCWKYSENLLKKYNENKNSSTLFELCLNASLSNNLSILKDQDSILNTYHDKLWSVLSAIYNRDLIKITNYVRKLKNLKSKYYPGCDDKIIEAENLWLNNINQILNDYKISNMKEIINSNLLPSIDNNILKIENLLIELQLTFLIGYEEIFNYFNNTEKILKILKSNFENKNIFLRILTHIVLWLKFSYKSSPNDTNSNLNLLINNEIFNLIIENYIDYLIDIRNFSLVIYYSKFLDHKNCINKLSSLLFEVQMDETLDILYNKENSNSSIFTFSITSNNSSSFNEFPHAQKNYNEYYINYSNDIYNKLKEEIINLISKNFNSEIVLLILENFVNLCIKNDEKNKEDSQEEEEQDNEENIKVQNNNQVQKNSSNDKMDIEDLEDIYYNPPSFLKRLNNFEEDNEITDENPEGIMILDETLDKKILSLISDSITLPQLSDLKESEILLILSITWYKFISFQECTKQMNHILTYFLLNSSLKINKNLKINHNKIQPIIFDIINIIFNEIIDLENLLELCKDEGKKNQNLVSSSHSFITDSISPSQASDLNFNLLSINKELFFARQGKWFSDYQKLLVFNSIYNIYYQYQYLPLENNNGETEEKEENYKKLLDLLLNIFSFNYNTDEIIYDDKNSSNLVTLEPLKATGFRELSFISTTLNLDLIHSNIKKISFYSSKELNPEEENNEGNFYSDNIDDLNDMKIKLINIFNDYLSKSQQFKIDKSKSCQTVSQLTELKSNSINNIELFNNDLIVIGNKILNLLNNLNFSFIKNNDYFILILNLFNECSNLIKDLENDVKLREKLVLFYISSYITLCNQGQKFNKFYFNEQILNFSILMASEQTNLMLYTMIKDEDLKNFLQHIHEASLEILSINPTYFG